MGMTLRQSAQRWRQWRLILQTCGIGARPLFKPFSLTMMTGNGCLHSQAARATVPTGARSICSLAAWRRARRGTCGASGATFLVTPACKKLLLLLLLQFGFIGAVFRRWIVRFGPRQPCAIWARWVGVLRSSLFGVMLRRAGRVHVQMN